MHALRQQGSCGLQLDVPVLNRARIALVLSALVYDNAVCGEESWTSSHPGAAARLAALARLFPTDLQDAVLNQLEITRIDGSSTAQVLCKTCGERPGSCQRSVLAET